VYLKRGGSVKEKRPETKHLGQLFPVQSRSYSPLSMGGRREKQKKSNKQGVCNLEREKAKVTKAYIRQNMRRPGGPGSISQSTLFEEKFEGSKGIVQDNRSPRRKKNIAT